MSPALMRSTQVSITLSLQISTDREAELLSLLFLLFVPVLLLLQIRHKVNRFWNELRLLAADIEDLLNFIGKVIVITFKSFAYGLGFHR